MQEAEMHSPALHQPLEEIKLSCIVGADELPEFIRQTGILPSLWSGFGIDTGNWQVKGRHHFDIIDDLQKSDSPLTLHMLGIKTLRYPSFLHGFKRGDRSDEINQITG